MGDDTALPPLGGSRAAVFSYLRQRFAQVTNPPIDHLRERSLMSLQTLIGGREPLLSHGPAGAHLIELESFFLYPSALDELRGIRLSTGLHDGEGLRPCAASGSPRRPRRRRPRSRHPRARRRGPPERAIPSCSRSAPSSTRLVAAGAAHARSLVVVSDEPRDSHHFACLLGYGADAVCPRLALETVAALADADRLGGDHPSPGEAQRRFRAALEDGVLKVMAKMGISDVASYRGAQLFEALGLAPDVIELCLTGTPSPLGGIGFAELERELRARSSRRRQAREPGLRQVPAGRRAARDEPRGGRVAAGRGGRACAPPAVERRGWATTAASPRSSTGARRSSCATCSSSSPPARPCRSTRSSRSSRSCAASRAAACRTARSRPRRTRRSRSPSTASAAARTAARAARIPRASATSATPASSRSRRGGSASRRSTPRTRTSSRSRSPRAPSPARGVSFPATR